MNSDGRHWMSMPKVENPQEVYVVDIRLTEFSEDNILRAARTLSEKPVFLNGRRLEFPLNMVFRAEYDEATHEIKVALISTEKEIHDNCEKSVPLFVSAAFLEKNLPRLYFTSLVLDTQPFKSGYKTKLKKVPDLKTALRLLFPVP